MADLDYLLRSASNLLWVQCKIDRGINHFINHQAMNRRRLRICIAQCGIVCANEHEDTRLLNAIRKGLDMVGRASKKGLAMQAYKVILNNGDHFYTRAERPWHLADRPDTLRVEYADETPYVKAACIFYSGVVNAFLWSREVREAIIWLIADGECLWHAVSLVCKSRCYCARCQPNL
jgi:hypothetical protein